MQIHNLSGKNKKQKRVGRGGKRGTYSGRGGKGQTARSGHRIRPAIRDYLKQIPKSRGRHKHSFKSVRQKPATVSIGDLERTFASNEVVSPQSLVLKGLLHKFGSHTPRVKILGSGKLTKKLTIKFCAVSKSARKAIEEAGGTIL